MQEVGSKRLKVLGTGFYITRYGLVATAKHVMEELKVRNELTLLQGFVIHLGPDNTVFLRPIRRAHLLEAADVAVVQADNFVESHPNAPLMNLRPRLSAELPAAGERLVTYAYPENAILDFDRDGHTPEIRGDYFQGGFLRFVSSQVSSALANMKTNSVIGRARSVISVNGQTEQTCRTGSAQKESLESLR